MATNTVPQFNLSNLSNLVSDGTIFSVEFIKRSNGELRKMVCRLGVKKHLRGGNKAYDSKQYNLLTVFDMEQKGYRSIPVDAIQRLSVNGQTFNFSGV
jgi:WYL domain-containing protein